MIWKIWKTNKLNSEILKIWKKRVIRYGQYGRKASWNVKWYGKYGRKISWIVKWFGQYGRKASRRVIRCEQYKRKVA
jgi:hypothetical protein